MGLGGGDREGGGRRSGEVKREENCFSVYSDNKRWYLSQGLKEQIEIPRQRSGTGEKAFWG